jgi:hypothetical protein
MGSALRVLASLAAILATGGVGACGGGDNGSDEDAVRETVSEFVRHDLRSRTP